MENGTLNRRFLILWIILFGSVFYNVEAALKTTFIEDLCFKKNSNVIDLRYQSTGILMSAPQLRAESDFDCKVTLLPPKDISVVLSIFRYEIYPGDLLTIQDSDHYIISLLEYGTFRDEKKSFISDGKMVIHYRRSNATTLHPRFGFQFTFTKVADSPCFHNEFTCQNGKCVNKDYVCDGHNHCGDLSEQKNCAPKDSLSVNEREGSSSTTVWLAIIITAGIVVLIVVIVFIVVVVRQSKRKKAANSNPNPPTQTSVVGEVALQSVSATVPTVTELQQPATVPEATQGPSLYDRVHRSLHRPRSVTTENLPKQHTSAEIYQVPSMYPSLDQGPSMYPSLDQVPSAPEIDGIDNPEVESED